MKTSIVASLLLVLFIVQTASAAGEFVYRTTTEANIRYVSTQLKRLLNNSYTLLPGSIDLTRYAAGFSLVGTGVTTVLGQQLNQFQVNFQVIDSSGNVLAGQVVLFTEDVSSGKPLANNETSVVIESINGIPKDNVRKRASPEGNIHKWTSC